MLLLKYLSGLSSETIAINRDGLFLYLVAASALFIAYCSMGENSVGKGGFPIANPRRNFEFVFLWRVVEFIKTPRAHLASFTEKYPNTPYWLNFELGKALILPSHMINEIRVNPKMSSLAAIQQVQNGALKGFEPIGEAVDEHMLRLIKEHLTTKSLGKMIPSISEEVSESLSLIYPDCSEWKEFKLGNTIVHLVARTSSRVFGGKTFCRSDAWLHAMADYTKHFLIASIILRFFPTWSKSWVQWVLPPCWLLRWDLVKCRRVIKPILEQRQFELERAKENGEEVEYAFDQTLSSLGKKFDMATVHITLAMVAIHTTADLLEKTLLVLTEHPELIQPLRQEVIDVLGTHGLSSAGLARLELMDSVLKETQRMNPVANCFLNRISLEDYKLSNGMVVPKGTLLGVGPTHMWDNTFYEKGGEFDPYRFHRMREDPEKKSQASFVSTSTHHLGFGHGSHSCPGRFFAANEIKILLSHILLKYEWKIPGEGAHVVNLGVLNAVHPRTKLELRQRTPELDLDNMVTNE